MVNDAVLKSFRQLLNSIFDIKYFFPSQNISCIIVEKAVALSSVVIFDALLQQNVHLVLNLVLLVHFIQKMLHFRQQLQVTWHFMAHKVIKFAKLLWIISIDASCFHHFQVFRWRGSQVTHFKFCNTSLTTETNEITF